MLDDEGGNDDAARGVRVCIGCVFVLDERDGAARGVLVRIGCARGVLSNVVGRERATHGRGGRRSEACEPCEGELHAHGRRVVSLNEWARESGQCYFVEKKRV